MRELTLDEYTAECIENENKLSMIIKDKTKSKSDKFVTAAKILNLNKERCHLIGDMIIGYEFEEVLIKRTISNDEIILFGKEYLLDNEYLESCVKVEDNYKITFIDIIAKPITDSLSRIWSYIVINAKNVVPDGFKLVDTDSFDDYFEYKNKDGEKIEFDKNYIQTLYFDWQKEKLNEKSNAKYINCEDYILDQMLETYRVFSELKNIYN